MYRKGGKLQMINKIKIIRTYPEKPSVKDNEVDIENILFDSVRNGTISLAALGFFMTLKSYANNDAILKLDDMGPESEFENAKVLKELEIIGLIKSTINRINSERVKIIYLYDPYKVL